MQDQISYLPVSLTHGAFPSSWQGRQRYLRPPLGQFYTLQPLNLSSATMTEGGFANPKRAPAAPRRPAVGLWKPKDARVDSGAP